MKNTRAERVTIANQFLLVISNHGRQFFRHGKQVSRFELDARGRVWFVDKWEGSRIYTHRHSWGWRFSDGGTLMDLCRDLREYIMGRAPLPAGHLGPWSDWQCDGDLWGYGTDAMGRVRSEVAELVS